METLSSPAMTTKHPPTQPGAGLWTANAAALWLLICVLLASFSLLLAPGKALRYQDFRAFYAAGEIVRHHPALLFDLNVQQASEQDAAGPGPMLPLYHPAYEALLFAPVSLVGYKTAYFLYMAVNMLLLWACYITAPAAASSFARSFPRPVLFFLSFPLLLCVFVGQDSLLFLLVLGLAWNALQQRKDRLAGLLVGLLLFKLAIVITLVFLIALRRGRTFLYGFLLAASALAVLSISLTGLSGTRLYLHLLGAASLAADHSVQAQRQAAVWLHAMPTLSGLLYLCGTRLLSAKAAFAANIAASLTVFLSSAWLIRTVKQEAVALSAALICALLLSPHLYIYDYAALLLPILLLNHPAMKFVALLWFVEPPILYAIGFLTWFAPAVVIPLLLLALCFAELAKENSIRRGPAPKAAPFLTASP
jgi:hypothetical protein